MTPKNRTFKGKNRRMFPKEKVILFRSSLHFVVGYPFIVLVSNFTKFFFVGRLLERLGRGSARRSMRRRQDPIVRNPGALKETLMLGFIAKARFWQPQIGLLSAEPLAGLCC
jgi:hypothetical protein